MRSSLAGQAGFVLCHALSNHLLVHRPAARSGRLHDVADFDTAGPEIGARMILLLVQSPAIFVELLLTVSSVDIERGRDDLAAQDREGIIQALVMSPNTQADSSLWLIVPLSCPI